jgi:hypothetical protein
MSSQGGRYSSSRDIPEHSPKPQPSPYARISSAAQARRRRWLARVAPRAGLDATDRSEPDWVSFGKSFGEACLTEARGNSCQQEGCRD